MDLHSAIGKHAEWKMKLRSAIAKKEPMDAASIRKDNCCELGKWLYAEGKVKFGAQALFSEVTSKHAVFHVEATKVAGAINGKKYVEATAMLEAAAAFASASGAVGAAIVRLKKDACI